MRRQRRRMLKTVGGLGAVGLLPLRVGDAGAAAATPDLPGFDTRSIDEVIAALGAGRPTDSAEIRITAPAVAEDGRTVSIGVASGLPGTDRIVLLVEKNPVKVVASYTLPDGTAPAIQTRVKMNETSNVYALVRAGGEFYVARREVRVIVGGCGL